MKTLKQEWWTELEARNERNSQTTVHAKPLHILMDQAGLNLCYGGVDELKVIGRQ